MDKLTLPVVYHLRDTPCQCPAGITRTFSPLRILHCIVVGMDIQLARSKSVYSCSLFIIMSTCNGGTYDIQALPQGSSYYANPVAGANNACKCSGVVYSLLSACDACQGDLWITWDNYAINCTTDHPVSYYPVPGGTRVPNWALIDITVEGNWNSSKSLTVGDLPEVLSGEMISGISTSTSSVVPSSTVTTSTSSSISSSEPTDTATSSSPSSSAGSSSNGGAIAGGVAGGVVAVSAAALLLFFFLRRRRAQQGPPAAAAVYDGTPQPLMGEVQSPPPDDGSFIPPPLPTTLTTPMRLYDPNDPTTFPVYQGIAPAPAAEVSTEAPNMYAGSTVASTQPSQPQGYHGLPTV
ncbi:hypothetical protein BGW80DRAFT_1560727 [Lactifluus volemus]|nr:hypothetical protein BGW80DRAFT_1560727 [Lactifluus volemus]